VFEHDLCFGAFIYKLVPMEGMETPWFMESERVGVDAFCGKLARGLQIRQVHGILDGLASPCEEEILGEVGGVRGAFNGTHVEDAEHLAFSAEGEPAVPDPAVDRMIFVSPWRAHVIERFLHPLLDEMFSRRTNPRVDLEDEKQLGGDLVVDPALEEGLLVLFDGQITNLSGEFDERQPVRPMGSIPRRIVVFASIQKGSILSAVEDDDLPCMFVQIIQHVSHDILQTGMAAGLDDQCRVQERRERRRGRSSGRRVVVTLRRFCRFHDLLLSHNKS